MSTRCNIFVKVKKEDIGKQIFFTSSLLDEPIKSIEQTLKWTSNNPLFPEKEYLRIYCHCDGYPEGVGKLLLEHFNSYEKALNLTTVGDISSLRPLSPFFDFPASPLDDIQVNSNIEYVYLFKDNTWYMAKPKTVFGSHALAEETFTPVADSVKLVKKETPEPDINQRKVFLPKPILRHSIGVAEFMAQYAITHPKETADPYEYYVIGLLHDIGKLYPGDPDPNGKNKYKNHPAKGGYLLENMGFTRYKEVMHHGHPEDGYFSYAWLVLNLADLSINSKGEIIPIADRIKDIGMRYGTKSEEYQHAAALFGVLKENNMIDENGNIL